MIMDFSSIVAVTIDLLDPSFQPGSKHYDRVFRCLKNHTSLKFDWIMKWEPHGNVMKFSF